ncbi:uncharacterized protein NPIL_30321 [Nephila pilipes]|uniref:Uncharacterized protein n=1 Tax=Nephila pilipes TaxID=299642 RepID=A0A8X6PX09_NEPPI|nr:uncharacterized protein NPIL_30321 [Nephila pilipes]
MEAAGMDLRKWITNDTNLMEQWKKENFDVHPVHETVSLGANETKDLGLSWNSHEDYLTTDTKSLLEFVSLDKNTKRFILQAVGKIFDPLGLISPFTVRMKCLLQDLWKEEIQWDDPLPTHIEKEWKKWLEELPHLGKLNKFSGDARDYLTFWSQFRKNHEDSSIANEDKFHYLLHVVPKSKAARVLDSFPTTEENYPKAVTQLHERFGREDLHVQIYVRDLLSMVMKNAATGRSKTELPALYDESKAKIRDLENLGRTQEKFGDFLSPLVEFYLQEFVLVTWERS